MSNGKRLTFALIDAKHCIALLNIRQKEVGLGHPEKKNENEWFRVIDSAKY